MDQPKIKSDSFVLSIQLKSRYFCRHIKYHSYDKIAELYYSQTTFTWLCRIKSYQRLYLSGYTPSVHTLRSKSEQFSVKNGTFRKLFIRFFFDWRRTLFLDLNLSGIVWPQTVCKNNSACCIILYCIASCMQCVHFK